MDMRIATERLLIREFELTDLRRDHTPRPGGDADAPLQPFDLRKPESIRQRIRAAVESHGESPRLTWDLAVLTSDDDRLIGRAGLQKNAEFPGEAMVWFVTDPSAWNQGFTSEGARAIIDFCFGELHLHRIWAECDPDNEGAVKLLEGLGLRREAHFVEAVMRDGQWCDSLVFAQLEREWKKAHRA